MGRIKYFIAAFIISQLSMPAFSQQVTQETLLDRILIEDIMITFYSELTDYSGARDHLNAYYLDDAVMEVNGLKLNGASAIKQAYETRQNETIETGNVLKMLLSNPRIVINGDTAHFDGIWTGVLNRDLQSQPIVLEQGVEETVFVKVNGQWKIKHRVITSLSNMPDAWDGD